MLDSDGGLGRSEAAAVTILLIEDDPGDAVLVEEMASDAVVEFVITWARSLDEAHTCARPSGASPGQQQRHDLGFGQRDRIRRNLPPAPSRR